MGIRDEEACTSGRDAWRCVHVCACVCMCVRARVRARVCVLYLAGDNSLSPLTKRGTPFMLINTYKMAVVEQDTTVINQMQKNLECFTNLCVIHAQGPSSSAFD